METLEEQLNERETVIRNYLLDRVAEETARAIDEKIFLEPDFYDLVQLIEQEIVADLVAGRLRGEEKERAERIYGLPGNSEKIEFEAALLKAAENLPREAAPPLSMATATRSVQEPVEEKKSRWFNWRYLIPAFTGLIIVFSLLTWYLYPGKRASLEKELALLNRENRTVANQIQTVTLESDAVRSAGRLSIMPKVDLSRGDEIIGFRLGLITGAEEIYKATFIDEQGGEMFSVSELKIQSDDNGRYVFVQVPSRFFDRGDFQVNLQGRSAVGAPTRAGSFTFRVVRP